MCTQARGVTYAPVTEGFNATDTSRVDQNSACACTTDGTSGSIFLGTELSRCKQHGLNMGDTDYYCYVSGGTDCATATASNSYPG